jgi:hypothetical protein
MGILTACSVVDYDNALELVLDRHQANRDRKRGQMRTILSNWNRLPDAALPSDLQPPLYSASFLGVLAALGKICSIDVAVPLLRSVVDIRKSTINTTTVGVWTITLVDNNTHASASARTSAVTV